jgi:hypothetical protein
MTKLEIMKQPSVQTLLEEMIRHKPGISTQRLWETVKEWNGKVREGAGVEFDMALMEIRDKYRCTNKQWYPIGHIGEPVASSGKKEDPRQVRMDW